MEFFFKKVLIKPCLMVFALCLGNATFVLAANDTLYKPFVMANTPAGDFNAVIASTTKTLTSAGFNIVGSYAPYKNAHVISVTNQSILNIVKNETSGAYGAVQRIAIADVDGDIQVSFTNPEYMAYVYRFKNNFKSLRQQLIAALGFKKDFGAEGLTEDDLRDYNYAWGMEKFDEPDELADYDSYEQAIAAVEKGLKSNKIGSYKVYRVDIPGKNMTVFGVGLKSPNMFNKYQDDGFVMGVIDFENEKHLPHLPYELVVDGSSVEALNGRFRIAISFPDLSMMGDHSFMEIMGAPTAIRSALTTVSGGDSDDF